MSDPREPFETIRPPLIEAVAVEEGPPPRVRVALEHGNELFVRDAAVGQDPSIPAPYVAAAAEATVAALNLLTPAAVHLTLQWSAVVPTGEGLPPVAMTVVGLEVAGVPLRYAGAVITDGDSVISGAKAALDAVNRRLGVTGL